MRDTIRTTTQPNQNKPTNKNAHNPLSKIIILTP